MTIESTDPIATQDDPLAPLYELALIRQIVDDGPWTVGCEVGQSWVMLDSMGQWWVDADEPATAEQVQELVMRAGGRVVLLDCE